MKALWKLCLVVVVGVGGLAGQMPPEAKCGMIELVLEEDSYGLYWRPDTVGYPKTLSTSLINSEGEAWRAVAGGHYEIMRPDGSFTFLDKNGVFMQSGTWFMIENYQITDHPYQAAGPATVNIVYYNFQGDNGKMKTNRSYYVPCDSISVFNVGAHGRNGYYKTKAPKK